jgi:type II secretory pathway component PulJ
MAHLTRLRVAEVDMERDLRRALPTSLISDLDNEVPEAALLLSAYRADNITVR